MAVGIHRFSTWRSVQASAGRRRLQSGGQCDRAAGRRARNLRAHAPARMRTNRPVPDFPAGQPPPGRDCPGLGAV